MKKFNIFYTNDDGAEGDMQIDAEDKEKAISKALEILEKNKEDNESFTITHTIDITDSPELWEQY